MDMWVAWKVFTQVIKFPYENNDLLTFHPPQIINESTQNDDLEWAARERVTTRGTRELKTHAEVDRRGIAFLLLFLLREKKEKQL